MHVEGPKMKPFAPFAHHYSCFASFCGSERVECCVCDSFGSLLFPPAGSSWSNNRSSSATDLNLVEFSHPTSAGGVAVVLQLARLPLREKVAGFIPVQAWMLSTKRWFMEDGGMGKSAACRRRTGAAGSRLLFLSWHDRRSPTGGRWEQSDGNRHRLNETETKIDPKTFFWGAETCQDPEFLL